MSKRGFNAVKQSLIKTCMILKKMTKAITTRTTRISHSWQTSRPEVAVWALAGDPVFPILTPIQMQCRYTLASNRRPKGLLKAPILGGNPNVTHVKIMP